MQRPDDHADRAPDSTAVVVPATGQRISYRTMVDQSRRLANVLREHGLRPGDHVAIFMTNVPEYFEAVWAARRAGFVYTAINWHLTPGEVRYMLENSESRALIVPSAAVTSELVVVPVVVVCSVVVCSVVVGSFR